MTVSVIMPARNAAETIEEALDSLLAQEWTDWRLVIIDDGSTDETRAIAERYAAADRRITVIDGPRRGAGAARNAGLAALREDWVLFFDADDTLLPAMLRRMNEALADNPWADAAHVGWIYTDWQGRELSRRRCTEPDPDLFPALSRFCALTIHTCLFRRSFYDRAGPIDETLTTSEDFDLWQRMARLGMLFVGVPEYLCTYRLREGQTWFDAARFLEDVLMVVERGHSADPRLPADQVPEYYAHGMPREGLFSAQLQMVVWAAGTLISRGQDPLPTLDALTAEGFPRVEPQHVADALHTVVPMVASRAPSSWFERWDELAPPIATFLEALAARTGLDDLATGVAASLELIVAHSAGPELGADRPVIAIGKTAAIRCEAREPLTDLDLPGIERAVCHVFDGGAALGQVELPVFGGQLASAVVHDALAARFYWQLLGTYLWRDLYPPLLDANSGREWAARRARLLGGGVPAAEELHDKIGWQVLLEEIFAPSTRRGPERPVSAAAGEREAVEASMPLPTLTGVGGPLDIDLTLGGARAVTLKVEPGRGAIDGAAIREAARAQAGLELARVAVREAVLGWPGETAEPLHVRLARSAEALPAGADPIAAVQRALPAGAAILGPPPGLGPSELARRAELPPGLAAEALARARAPQLAAPGSEALPERLFAAPELACGPRPPDPPPPPLPDLGDIPALYGRHHFERLFSHGADPWQYTSPYEQRKYEQTLALLPENLRGEVLEIGCAEGHFTAQLAPLVERLAATDISDLALERAAARCAEFDNISYRQVDILHDPLEGEYDAVFCCELLYYMGGLEALGRVGAKIAGVLKPGGVLITAHANLVVDDPRSSGFDWRMPYGAKRIGETFAALPELDFEHELVTPLYRIQLFRKRAGKTRLPWRAGRTRPRTREEGDFVEPEPKVAQHILWEGGKVASEVRAVTTDRLPILMYHSVADDGPEPLSRWRVAPAMFEAQMRYLREAGFTPATFAEWREARERREPLPGRRVIITFDDIYTDFEREALPILQRYGLEATLFAPAGKLGGQADWDAWAGPPLPLVDLDGLRRLRDAGMRIGSHGLSHRPLAGLAPGEVVDELWRSRALLEQELGVEVDAFAYPLGSYDEIAERLAAACFYAHAVTVNDDVSTLGERDLALSRIEVRGGEDLAHFIRRMPE